MKKLSLFLPLLVLVLFSCNSEESKTVTRDPFDESNIDFSDYSDEDWEKYYERWDKNYALIFSPNRNFNVKVHSEPAEIKKIAARIKKGKTENPEYEKEWENESYQMLEDYLSYGKDSSEQKLFEYMVLAEDSLKRAIYSNWYFSGKNVGEKEISSRIANLVLEDMADTAVSYYTIQIAERHDLPGYKEKLADMLEDDDFLNKTEIYSAYAREGDNLEGLEAAIDQFESDMDWYESSSIDGYVFSNFYQNGNDVVKSRVMEFVRETCREDYYSDDYAKQVVKNLITNTEDPYDTWLIERILPYSNSKGSLLQALVRLEGRSASRTIVQYLNDPEESLYDVLEAAIQMAKFGPDSRIVTGIMSNLDQMEYDTWMLNKAVWAVLMHGGEAEILEVKDWIDNDDIVENVYRAYRDYNQSPEELHTQLIDLNIWNPDSSLSIRTKDEMYQSSYTYSNIPEELIRQSGRQYWMDVESYQDIPRYDSMATDMAKTSGSLDSIQFFMEYIPKTDSTPPILTLMAQTDGKAYIGNPRYFTGYHDVGFMDKFMNTIAKKEGLEGRFVRINPSELDSRFIYGPPEGVKEFARKYLF